MYPEGRLEGIEFERVSYPADAQHSAAAREGVRAWLESSRVPAEVAHGLLLAVSEAVDNVVKHAYPPEQAVSRPVRVELTMCHDRAELVVAVADHGLWVQPATTALEHDTSDHPARHGRGITLMNAHVDDVAIHFDRDGTTVVLRAQLGRREPARSTAPQTAPS